jgi:hypothetical protein
MFRICVIFFALAVGSAEMVKAQELRTQSRERDPGPVAMLLQLESHLRLSATQVDALREIETEMNRLNGPLVARMSEIRGRMKRLGDVDSLTAEQRVVFDTYVAELRPVVDQIQENNWAAMRRVGDVLTDRQKERLSRFLRESNDDDRDRSSNLPRAPSPGN